MSVLLDECIDWRLSRDLSGHDVKTARQMGWASVANGELLALATKSFDVFVTLDRNLSSQQTLTGRTIAVIVLRARSSRLADLRLFLPDLLRTIETARPGAAVFVGRGLEH